jgi:hypothetical protein
MAAATVVRMESKPEDKPAEAPSTALTVAGTTLPIDMSQIPEHLREMIMGAAAGTAAALQRQEAEQPEFYGHAPTDLNREFSDLPRPAQGGRRRPSQRRP